MNAKRLTILAVVLALIDFFVPFYLLKNVESFMANYLFWSLLALLTVLFGAYVTRKWGEEND